MNQIQKANINPKQTEQQVFKYYMRDAQDGIRRNLGAALATVLLIFISLTITGTTVLLKTSVDDVIQFLNDQVKIKVFLDANVDAEKAAEIIRSKSYVQSVDIETKEESLDRLQQFFKDKPYLFDAFRDSSFPDTLLIELKDKNQAEMIAAELKDTQGISEVIFAQEFAEQVLAWSNAANTYGGAIIVIFLLASILTVGIAMNLALYQRQKDIRVKLLLGAKEMHVRGQFLFEGVLIGFVGSLLSAGGVYLVYQLGLSHLQSRFSAVFNFNALTLNLTLLGMIIFGMLIGLLGTYAATRKLMKHA